jgi:molybdopterin molybdotransferase
MDGYAVRAADTAGATEASSVRLEVTGEVAMGRAATIRVSRGAAVRVATGAMLPPGADAVVITERTEPVGADRIAITEPASPGQNIVRIGEDLKRGECVFERGHRVRGSDVGVLTGVGASRVEVHRVPRVAVMATGDEIVEPEAELGLGQVRNVNEYLLASLAKQAGAVVRDYGVVGDEASILGRVVREAVEECDVVLISGGSSKGPRDLTRGAIESVPSAEVLLHGIAIAPGKPTIFARAGRAALVGMPGNPAAVAVVFRLFAEPLVRVLGGELLPHILLTRPTVRARLARDVASTPGREDYLRARLRAGDGLPVAEVLPGKSVALSTIARADGLVRIPLSCEGLEAGTEVDLILL